MATFKDITNNISTIKEDMYKLEDFDIGTLFMPDDDIVKNILKIENAALSTFELSMIIDSADDFKSKIEDQKTKIQNEINTARGTIASGLTSSIDPNQILSLQNRIDKLDEFLDMRDAAEEAGVYPISKDSGPHKRAKEIKEKVRSTFRNLKNDLKDVLEAIKNTAIILVNTISGVVLLIGFPPFNIPTATTMVMMVIDSIKILITKFKKMINDIGNLELIKYVISMLPPITGDKIPPISKAINKINGFLLKIKQALNWLTEIKEKVIDFVKQIIDKLSNPDNTKKILRKNSARLKELNYFSNRVRKIGEGVNEEDKPEVEQILSRFVVTNESGPRGSNSWIALKFKDDEIGKNIKDLQDASTEVELGVGDLTRQLDVYPILYDVRLPNGQVIEGVDEDYIEDLKQIYNVVIK